MSIMDRFRDRLKTINWGKHIVEISRAALLMFVGVFVFIGFLYYADTNTNPVKSIHNIFAASVYKAKAFEHMDDNISVSISELCRDVPVDVQAACVVSQVNNFYNYSEYNDTILRSPDEYVIKGGVCRDTSILYHTIFSRLGWYTSYDFTVPGHVYLTIIKDINNVTTTRCIIDSTEYFCMNIGG